jgi:hypothetical protein
MRESRRPPAAGPVPFGKRHTARILIEQAYGKAPTEIKLEDEQPRQTGEQVIVQIVEMLPRVVAMLPADRREELARLFE